LQRDLPEGKKGVKTKRKTFQRSLVERNIPRVKVKVGSDKTRENEDAWRRMLTGQSGEGELRPPWEQGMIRVIVKVPTRMRVM